MAQGPAALRRSNKLLAATLECAEPRGKPQSLGPESVTPSRPLRAFVRRRRCFPDCPPLLRLERQSVNTIRRIYKGGMSRRQCLHAFPEASQGVDKNVFRKGANPGLWVPASALRCTPESLAETNETSLRAWHWGVYSYVA